MVLGFVHICISAFLVRIYFVGYVDGTPQPSGHVVVSLSSLSLYVYRYITLLLLLVFCFYRGKVGGCPIYLFLIYWSIASSILCLSFN